MSQSKPTEEKVKLCTRTPKGKLGSMVLPKSDAEEVGKNWLDRRLIVQFWTEKIAAESDL